MENQQSEASSFKEIYFSEYESLFKAALYIVKDSVVAEDVVQEVFTKLWERKEGSSEILNLKSYLFRMTKNLAFDIYSSSKKLKAVVLELERTEMVAKDSEQDLAFRNALQEAVSKLSPKCRLIFSLSRFEGLSNNEIAEHLDISKRTVETQISNALKAFRTDLKPIFEAHLMFAIGATLTSFLRQI